MADIRINDLPLEATPNSSEYLAIDGESTRKSTIQNVVNSGALAVDGFLGQFLIANFNKGERIMLNGNISHLSSEGLRNGVTTGQTSASRNANALQLSLTASTFAAGSVRLFGARG